MTYRVVPSKRFQKTVQKYNTGGQKRVLQAAAEVIDLLVVRDNRALFVLGTRWRDHALKGNKHGIRELHLNQDDLLLYTVDEELRIIKLLDIVSHEDLHKRGSL